MKKVGSFIFLALASLGIFTGCDVGLGESVDTQAPVVSISYPPASSIVRENFILSGTCDDDRGIKEVIVTVYNTENSEEKYVYNAKVEGKNWTCELNNKNDEGIYPLKDGKYQFEAVAIDTSDKKSGVNGRSIEIDNTAPVFMIKNPGVVSISNASTFGSILKVEGEMDDDHEVSSMSLTVYDADKSSSPLASWTEKDISTSGGTSVTFARYLSSGSDELSERYNKIYGDTKDSINFYSTVEVSDKAGIWRTPGKTVSDDAESGLGNKTAFIYLYNDIYKSYMSKNSKYKFSVRDLKRIENNTYGNLDSDVPFSTDEKKVLLGLKRDSSIYTNFLAFKLNKDASPKYTVTGFSVKDANFSVNRASKEQKVTLQANAGFDGTYFNPNQTKLKMYLFGPFENKPSALGDSTDVINLSNEEIVKIYDNPAKAFDEYKVDSKAAILYDGSGETLGEDSNPLNEPAPDSSVGSYSVSVTLPKIIKSNFFYIFAVSGKDDDDSEFTPDDNQFIGFKGVDDSNLYLLFDESTKNQASVKGGESQIVKGTISLNKIEDLESVERFNTDSDYAIKGTAEAAWISGRDDAEQTLTVTSGADGSLHFSDLITGEQIGSVTSANRNVRRYVVKDKYAHEARLDFNYYVDSIEPTVSSIAGFDKWNNSETVQLKVVVGDKGIDGNTYSSKISSVSYVINPGQPNEISGEMAVGKSCDSTGNIDGSGKYYNLYQTTADLPQGSVPVKITAVDNVGNSKTVTYTWNVDSKEPVINSAEFESADANKVNVSNQSGSVKVSVTGKESKTASEALSGISKVEVKKGSVLVTEINLDPAVNEYSADILIPVKNTKVSPATLFVSEGTNIFSIYLYDKAGNVSASKEITIYADYTEPEVKYTSHESGSTVNKKIALSGTVTDNNAVKQFEKLQSSTNGTTWIDVSTANYDKSNVEYKNGKWTVPGFDTEKYADKNNIWVRAVFSDTYGNKSTGSGVKLAINQDSDRPEINLTNINTSGSAIKLSGTVLGTVTDDDGPVKGIYFIDSANYNGTLPAVNQDVTVNEVTTNNGWTKASGTASWSADAGKEGESSWYLAVIDAEDSVFHIKGSTSLNRPYVKGMEQTKADLTQAVTFNVDMNAPSVTMFIKHGDSANRALKSDDKEPFSTASEVFGGTNNYVWIKLEVVEEVGMSGEVNSVLTGCKVPKVEINGVVYEGAAFYSTPTVVRKGTLVEGVKAAETTYTYLLKGIDVSSYADGNLPIKCTVSDSTGQTGIASMNVTVDNSAPDVYIVSPTTNLSDAVNSAISVKGVVSDAAAGTDKIYWLIPENTVTAGVASPKVYNGTEGEWNQIAASASWEINFASGASDSTDSLLYYANAQVNVGGVLYPRFAISSTNTDGVYKVPVYFFVTDKSGNKSVRTQYKGEDLYVLVDSEGGLPKAWINSPEEGSTTSGVVTVYGGASDNVSVNRVLLQIDADSNGIFDDTDKALCSGTFGLTVNEESFKDKSGALVSTWSVATSGTNSWKCQINTKFVSLVDGKHTLRLRVRGVDSDEQSREWSDPYEINIDAASPTIKDLKLVQYGKNVVPGTSTKPVTEREYLSGMYISNISAENNGTWYLTCTIADEDGKVASITNNTLADSSVNVIPLSSETDLKSSGTTTDSGKTYAMRIPLNTSSSGRILARIDAKDNATNGTSKEISINIDSTPPSLYNISNSETTKNSADSLRIKALGKMLGNGTNVTENYGNVVNNNNFFTFGDTVSEAGSGLQYIAFYFERDGKSENRVYNPMLSAETGKSVLSATKANGKVYKNADGLAALYLSGLTRESDDSLTMASANPNVRTGGLVKIAGNYSRITKVDGKVVSFTPGCDKSLFTEAELIFAQVVDHMLSESIDSDNVTVINDDGDEMVETISQIGSGYIWSASVNSTNIPDGPVQLHVVAMDNAGNINSGYISTTISNNRPRITKVMLGTDLNGNGKYDLNATSAPIVSADEEKATADGKSYGEFSYYSAYNKNTGIGQSDVEIASGDFKVISGLMVIPEFTGGNNSLKYVLSYGTKATGPGKSASPASLSTRSALASSLVEQGKTMFGNSETASQNVISYKDYDFGGLVLASSHAAFATDKKTYLNLTFWDGTEETTQGTDSQWALLKIPVTVKSNDSVSPVAKIKPFYWKNSVENSIYTDSHGVLQGHIELESELTSSIISFLGSDDPKVSGKIKVEGIITDDVRLASINANVFGNSGVVGNYTNGTWVQAASLPAGVISFTATDLDMSQNGHSVKYSIVVDTEQLTGAAGKDKVIKVGATDWKGNASSAGSSQTKASVVEINDQSYETGTTDYYKMDVVPYVTQVWTGLSETKPNNPSMYARSSTGEYVVRGKTSGATYEDASTAGEVIKVYGWNLNNSPVVRLGPTIIEGTTVSENTNENVKQGTYGINFTVPDISSNSLSVTVNAIVNLNNTNDNDARGTAEENSETYAGYYNRQPNGDNNNTLTDDVKLDIWDFKNAVTPAGTAAKYVHMKVGPYLSSDSSRSGRIGFSFRNGAGFFNMPGYMAGSASTSGRFAVYIKSSTYNRAHMYSSAGNLTGDWPGKNMTSTSYNGSSGYYLIDVTGSYTGTVTVMFNQQSNESNKSNKYVLSSGPGLYVINSVGSGETTSNTITAVESYVVSDSTLYSQTKIGQNFQGFSHNTFTWDANGDSYGAALCSDTSGNDDMSANFQFFSRGYGESTDSLNFNYYNCTNGRRIENTKNVAGTYDEERVKSPAMATYVSGGKTYVYMAYWDHLENRIIYRVGSVGGSGSSSANDIGLGLRDLCGQTTHHTNYDKNNDVGKIGSTGFARRNSTDTTYTGDTRTGEASAYHYVKVLESFAGVTDAHVSVAALSDGSAVIAWYNDVSRSLKAVKISNADMLSGTLNSKSYTPVTISSNGGAYVSLAADSTNGLHFAYSSNSGANLYYAYATSTLSGITEMLVDVSDDVGDNCTIDVARSSSTGPWIPTITYKSNVATGTKIAYPVFASGATSSTRPTAGSTSGGQYTGAWAICTLPTSNKSIADLISVGYNKDWSNGVYKQFAVISETKKTTTGKYTICDSTIISGNGTVNPVVGYGIATGSIELAQRK